MGLFAHTYPIIGIEQGLILGGTHIGSWAVTAFFVLSGYLITASRQRTRFADFLFLRISRIFPAFLICLVVTVTIFAPVAQLINHGTLSGYLRTEPSPARYLFVNMFLDVGAYPIGDTLGYVPYPNAWNGSLWTLYYEFLCYLFVGLLLVWSRAKKTVLPIAIAFTISVVVYANIETVLSYVDHNPSFNLLTGLLPYFLAGALIRMLSPFLGLHWLPGIACLIGFVVAIISFGYSWETRLFSPLLAYGLLWLSTVIPQPQWVAKNDISYGLYIYAFPTQQILVVFGLAVLNPYIFSIIALLLASALATASWFIVERPALRRARQATGRPIERTTISQTSLAETQAPLPTTQ